MSRTPVSILQEYATKVQNTTPIYTFIEDKMVGSNDHQFTIRVTCCGYSVDGKDFSKQGAKHKAAEEMLLKLNYSKDMEKNCVVNSSSEINDTERNYIGLIHDFCAQKRLQPPVFTELNCSGPSHAMSFTVQCKVVGVIEIIEEATANTKKQARSEAALKVWQKLSNLYSKEQGSSVASENTTSLTIFNSSIESNGSSPERGANYIGLLNEHCAKKRKNIPVFTEVSLTGPAHMRNFTIQCKVGDIVGEGMGTTKKQAKSEAAKKVWEKLPNKYMYNSSIDHSMLMKEVKDLNIQVENLSVEEIIPDYKKENKLAEDKYLSLTKLKFTPLISEVVSLDECHKVFTSEKFSIPLREEILALLDQINTENHNTLFLPKYQKILENVAKLLNAKLTPLNFDAKYKSITYIVGYKLHTEPMIVSVGCGASLSLANMNAIFDAVESLKLLLN